MSEKNQLLAESDEDDEDYLPEGQSSASEEESDKESEVEDTFIQSSKKVGIKKRSKKSKDTMSKRLKNQETSLSDDKLTVFENEKPNDDAAQKKRADSLWADFLKDSAPSSKPTSKMTNKTEESDKCLLKTKIDNSVVTSTIFADEKIVVENKAAHSTKSKLSNYENTTNLSAVIKNKDRGIRKIGGGGGGGGISSVLGRLEKKTKINTLEKSKMDWDNFKKQEDIEEEINSHNRGKDGYLEKQDFLQRADFRQFEIEKQLRNSSRRNNNR
ncbi:craniofacial development protein 1 [Leptopilina heterotoma]|uniref:craniofacial development protein 1 n=1 Tax=Leptopilina heterotoma TaxID=63436 RepID=UPI001CAA1A1F|nr:craniofacial development protein 1 [Leptopilina heterotoma]